MIHKSSQQNHLIHEWNGPKKKSTADRRTWTRTKDRTGSGKKKETKNEEKTTRKAIVVWYVCVCLCVDEGALAYNVSV